MSGPHEDNEGQRTGPDDVPSQASVLDQPVRAKIHDHVKRFPGSNKNQMATLLGISFSHLDFHLERLGERDLIVQRPGDRDQEVLLFCKEDIHLWEDPQTRVLFGQSPIRQVALRVAEDPGITVNELADVSGRALETVRYHLRTLRENKLVAQLQLGRHTEYHPEERLLDWVRTVGDASSSAFEEEADTRGVPARTG